MRVNRLLLVVLCITFLTGQTTFYGPIPTKATSTTRIISTASDNATNIKASAATVFTVLVTNTTEQIAYVKLYDIATTPSCGSTPIISGPLPVPGLNQTASWGAPTFFLGIQTTSGLGICITGGPTDTDDTIVQPGIYVTILWN